MAVDVTTRIQPLRQPDPAQPSENATDTAAFRRLLESLEKLAEEHRQVTPVEDADAVERAIARADEGFSLAMDLRQRLEEAFRARMP